jgi:hypothetical protein
VRQPIFFLKGSFKERMKTPVFLYYLISLSLSLGGKKETKKELGVVY